ncbi:MAG: phosphoribosylanthranilate isomerase [bacterium]
MSPFGSYTKPRIKICCIQNIEEALLAIKHGASALGLVSEMPSGPGVLSAKKIAEIAAEVPPGIATFLLTSKQTADAIIEQQRRCRVNTLQLVDRLESGSYEDVRKALPGIAIVQVIHVTGEESVEEAESIAQHVDALLLDSGNPSLPVKELGGTGRPHDWSLSKQIRERVKIPIYLAGGLTPENVGKAVRQVGPFAVDVCSGVRTDGKLDEFKLSALIAGVKSSENR